MTSATSDWLLYTHHTSFRVGDLERSTAFYCDVLGFEVIRDADLQGPVVETIVGMPGTHMKWNLIKMDDHLLELIEYISPEGRNFNTELRPSDIGAAHICWHVRDARELYDRWREKGVEFVSEPVELLEGPNKGGYCCYLRDPDGYSLELIERPKHLQRERQL